MLRLSLLAVASGCFIGSWFLIYAAWPTPEPDLWIENPALNLGDLSQGQEVQAEFTLKNHFAEPLEIMNVIKGCTCSEAVLSRKQMQPGEQSKLQVVWKTGRARGITNVDLTVVYRISDGADQHKFLRISANVVPDIVCDPETLSFDGSRPESQALKLRSGRVANFVISSVHCNHAAFRARLHGTDTVEVTFDGKTPVYANGLEPRVVIQTDSPNEPQIYVPIEIRVDRPTQ